MPDAPTRMTAERLDELRRMAARPVGAPNSMVRALLSDQRELIAEIDALSADCKALAAECRCARKAWAIEALMWDGDTVQRCCSTLPAEWAAAERDTNESGALARHGSTTP